MDGPLSYENSATYEHFEILGKKLTLPISYFHMKIVPPMNTYEAKLVNSMKKNLKVQFFPKFLHEFLFIFSLMFTTT